MSSLTQNTKILHARIVSRGIVLLSGSGLATPINLAYNIIAAIYRRLLRNDVDRLFEMYATQTGAVNSIFQPLLCSDARCYMSSNLAVHIKYQSQPRNIDIPQTSIEFRKHGMGGSMKTSSRWLSGHTAICLALSLAIPVGQAGSAIAQQAAPSQQSTQGVSSQQAKEDMQATNAAVDTAVSTSSLPDNATPVSAHAQNQEGQPANSTSGTDEQNGARKPVGAAAAPYERTMGVAASRPAGAAIAPAKQRRVRTILISAGLIAGAAIAVGSVAALSHGTPGRP